MTTDELKTTYTVHGKDAVLGGAAAILDELSRLLWTNGKRFQVVIDCDPESGKFEMVRREPI